jgi:hypothetical protein
MGTRSDERSTIAKAGVETGEKILGVSIAWCTLVGASKVHANAKGLV